MEPPSRPSRRGRWAVGACIVSAALVVGTSGCSGDGTTVADPELTASALPAAPTWVPLWADEFDGDTLDTDAWATYHNTYGDGNDELACLTPGNVSIGDGTLRIEARAEAITCPSGETRRYSSGFLGSREVGRLFPLYARYEIRARVPHGQGLWPAFWLRHADGADRAEVDVLEIFHSQRPGDASQTLHFPGHLGTNAWSRTTFVETPVTGTGDWHTYAVEITEDASTAGVRFTFSVDDEVTGSFVDDTAPWRSGVDPARTWDIAVNLAVGGRWVGEPAADLGWLPLVGVCSRDLQRPDSGPSSCPTDGLHFASFPAVYEIDHVRVSVPAEPPPE